jgi:cytochrome d ubiquinol oxidase subunit I
MEDRPPASWRERSRRVDMAGRLAGLAFGPVDQHYLLQARQMQALSFAVHIPLVCFGIALPVMVLFVECLYLRSGDRVYGMLGRGGGRA